MSIQCYGWCHISCCKYHIASRSIFGLILLQHHKSPSQWVTWRNSECEALCDPVSKGYWRIRTHFCFLPEIVFFFLFSFLRELLFYKHFLTSLQVYYCIFSSFKQTEAHGVLLCFYVIFASYFVVEFINITFHWVFTLPCIPSLTTKWPAWFSCISLNIVTILIFHVYLIILKSDIWNFIYVSIWIFCQNICDCKEP